MKQAFVFIILTFLSVLFEQSVSAQTPDFTVLIDEERKIKGLKIGDQTPNELEGYRFFSEGKLKNIKLGISTKKDIEKVFGSNCEITCDYDSHWQIQFGYFDNKAVDKTQLYDEQGNKASVREVFVLPAYFGKLRSVEFIPTKRISFSKPSLPTEFERYYSTEFGEDKSGNLIAIGVNKHIDRYGLSYNIFAGDKYKVLKDAFVYKNFRDKSEIKRQEGDLVFIKYEIPAELEKKILVKSN